MMSVLAALIAFGYWLRLDSKGRLPRNRRQRELIRARQATAHEEHRIRASCATEAPHATTGTARRLNT
jgi:hypothetical protein